MDVKLVVLVISLLLVIGLLAVVIMLLRRPTTHSDTLSMAELLNKSSANNLQHTSVMLQPLQQTLDSLQKLVLQTEQDRKVADAQLQHQIQNVRETGKVIQNNAEQLVATMRAPKSRGSWGELHLRRVVEAAGLVNRCDFLEQDVVSGTGNRPDLVVNLGNNRCLYVDAKVPLDAFYNAVACENEIQKEQYLDSFKTAILNTVRSLGAKNYWQNATQIGMDSPEFVVMYIPAEGILVQAFELIPDLHERATKNNVIIAGPATLLALMRSVAYSLQKSELAANAKEIVILAGKLHKELATFGGHIGKLGASLGKTIDAYNAAVKSLESRAFKTAGKLAELGGEESGSPQVTILEHQIHQSRNPEMNQTP